MNTMYTSVIERTREIGIMKSIGARNSHIFLLFLIEAGFLGLAGGLIGVFLGIFFSQAVAFIGQVYLGVGVLKASLSPFLIFGALLFSFFTGAISGITPAYRAAKMPPVEALRK